MACNVCKVALVEGDCHFGCILHRKCTRKAPCSLDMNEPGEYWDEIEAILEANLCASPPRKSPRISKGKSGSSKGKLSSPPPLGKIVDRSKRKGKKSTSSEDGKLDIKSKKTGDGGSLPSITPTKSGSKGDGGSLPSSTLLKTNKKGAEGRKPSKTPSTISDKGKSVEKKKVGTNNKGRKTENPDKIGKDPPPKNTQDKVDLDPEKLLGNIKNGTHEVFEVDLDKSESNLDKNRQNSGQDKSGDVRDIPENRTRPEKVIDQSRDMELGNTSSGDEQQSSDSESFSGIFGDNTDSPADSQDPVFVPTQVEQDTATRSSAPHVGYHGYVPPMSSVNNIYQQPQQVVDQGYNRPIHTPQVGLSSDQQQYNSPFIQPSGWPGVNPAWQVGNQSQWGWPYCPPYNPWFGMNIPSQFNQFIPAVSTSSSIVTSQPSPVDTIARQPQSSSRPLLSSSSRRDSQPVATSRGHVLSVRSRLTTSARASTSTTVSMPTPRLSVPSRNASGFNIPGKVSGIPVESDEDDEDLLPLQDYPSDVDASQEGDDDDDLSIADALPLFQRDNNDDDNDNDSQAVDINNDTTPESISAMFSKERLNPILHIAGQAAGIEYTQEDKPAPALIFGNLSATRGKLTPTICMPQDVRDLQDHVRRFKGALGVKNPGNFFAKALRVPEEDFTEFFRPPQLDADARRLLKPCTKNKQQKYLPALEARLINIDYSLRTTLRLAAFQLIILNKLAIELSPTANDGEEGEDSSSPTSPFEMARLAADLAGQQLRQTMTISHHTVAQRRENVYCGIGTKYRDDLIAELKKLDLGSKQLFNGKFLKSFKEVSKGVEHQRVLSTALTSLDKKSTSRRQSSYAASAALTRGRVHPYNSRGRGRSSTRAYASSSRGTTPSSYTPMNNNRGARPQSGRGRGRSRSRGRPWSRF